MARKSDAQMARHVKQLLTSQYADRSWFRGIAIVPDDAGRLAIRVSMASTDKAAAGQLPDELEGVPVQVLFIDGYQPRSHSSEAEKKV